MAKRTDFDLTWYRIDHLSPHYGNPTYALGIVTDRVECFTLSVQRELRGRNVYHSLRWGDHDWNWASNKLYAVGW